MKHTKGLRRKKKCVYVETQKTKRKKTEKNAIRRFGIGFIFGTFSCDITWAYCRYFKEYLLVGR